MDARCGLDEKQSRSGSRFNESFLRILRHRRVDHVRRPCQLDDQSSIILGHAAHREEGELIIYL